MLRQEVFVLRADRERATMARGHTALGDAWPGPVATGASSSSFHHWPEDHGWVGGGGPHGALWADTRGGHGLREVVLSECLALVRQHLNAHTRAGQRVRASLWRSRCGVYRF